MKMLIGALVGTTMLSGLCLPSWADEYKGAPRTSLVNPSPEVCFNDTAKYKKAGPYTIGFANAGLGDSWRVVALDSMKKAAGEHKTVDCEQLVSTLPSGDTMSAFVQFRGGGTAYVSASLIYPFVSRFAVYGAEGWIEVRDKAHVEAPDGWIVTKGLKGRPITVEQMIKDFDLIMDTARADHVPMSMAALVRQRYEQAYVDGDGQRDFFVLCETDATRHRPPAAE